jgi:hypothetical protein
LRAHSDKRETGIGHSMVVVKDHIETLRVIQWNLHRMGASFVKESVILTNPIIPYKEALSVYFNPTIQHHHTTETVDSGLEPAIG